MSRCKEEIFSFFLYLISGIHLAPFCSFLTLALYSLCRLTISSWISRRPSRPLPVGFVPGHCKPRPQNLHAVCISPPNRQYSFCRSLSQSGFCTNDDDSPLEIGVRAKSKKMSGTIIIIFSLSLFKLSDFWRKFRCLSPFHLRRCSSLCKYELSWNRPFFSPPDFFSARAWRRCCKKYFFFSQTLFSCHECFFLSHRLPGTVSAVFFCFSRRRLKIAAYTIIFSESLIHCSFWTYHRCYLGRQRTWKKVDDNRRWVVVVVVKNATSEKNRGEEFYLSCLNEERKRKRTLLFAAGSRLKVGEFGFSPTWCRKKIFERLMNRSWTELTVFRAFGDFPLEKV